MKAARLVIAISIVALLVQASFELPLCSRGGRVCLDCGLLSQEREFLGLSLRWKTHRTGVTDWYDRRVGTPHRHRWSGSLGGDVLNLWQEKIGTHCSAGEPIARFGSLAPLLEKLQPLGLDRDLHRALTRADPNHRLAAGEAADVAACIVEEDRDPERALRAWWTRTQAYLRTARAWRAGFRSFGWPSR